MKVRLLANLALLILPSVTVLALAGCASSSNVADSSNSSGGSSCVDHEANGNPEKAWWN